MVYVPKGFAHGFQSLTDHSEVLYCISESYRAESAKGVRWDDSAFKIEWPIPEKIISERDQRFPDYKL
jgi:dTDP-4-dehydrorhamnose 3,5-epimerase